MDLVGDLSLEALAEALPGRPIRSYPALLSTEADALAWARAGAPEGALVAAEYQASPRGRAGLEWRLRAGAGFAFSIVLRPDLPAQREGWLYIVASAGLADALGADTLEWPDEVRREGIRAGAVAVQTGLRAEGVEWAVVSLLVEDSRPPRAALLAAAVEAVETRYRSRTASVLADYLRRCTTIGRDVRARLIPLGPGGVEIAGRAVNVLADGALVVETAAGQRLAIRPQSLGLLEPAG